MSYCPLFSQVHQNAGDPHISMPTVISPQKSSQNFPINWRESFRSGCFFANGVGVNAATGTANLNS